MRIFEINKNAEFKQTVAVLDTVSVARFAQRSHCRKAWNRLGR